MLDSDSRRNLIVGIGSTVVAAVIIGLFVSWIDGQKDDIIEELSDRIDDSESRLQEKIATANKARAVLAASLIAEGIDIPVNIFSDFAALRVDEDAKEAFTATLSSKNAITDTVAGFKQFSSSLPDFNVIYAADLTDKMVLMAYTSMPSISTTEFPQKTFDAVLTDSEGNETEVEVTANAATDVVDVLDQEGVKASNIVIVPKADPS